MADELIAFQGVDEWIRAVDGCIYRTNNATRDAVEEGLRRIEREAQRNSSGPARAREGGQRSGGPGVVSGRHRTGIHSEPPEQVAPGVWSGKVVSTSPQSRRLDRGFQGQDSLGRNYSQPAYPFLSTARNAEKSSLPQIFVQAYLNAMGG